MGKIILFFRFLIITVILIACNQGKKNYKRSQTSNNAIITFDGQFGWGYEVLIKNKPYIRQETIPAISGNRGFSSKEKAEKAAQFVIYKIEKNIMPPTVTVAELDSLGVLD